MRLFAAVMPPQEARDELGSAVRGLAALPGAGELRWADPGNWHLTLAFYGEVPEHTDDDLRERLARAAARSPRMELCLAGGGRFGAQVLWAGVGGDREHLTRLGERAAAAGRRAGLAMDPPGRFRPHLSLARPRKGRSADLRPFAAALDGFRGTPWTVTELTLVRSRLPDSGVPGEQPRYERVAGWPLEG
ncbi:RNA 2',3'-cyclic phosphodiesterase [Streptomyces sp. ODS28]|uniref:RNA 2',3'-cyclic phosphodiesterase n=1 Tax=Streptomyces sp. ODS28 TaxID=3136688 RepID=UPI0031EEDB58